MIKAMRYAALGAAVALLCACSVPQSLYSVTAAYSLAENAAATYIAVPGADPVKVAQIKAADNAAYAAVKPLVDAEANGTSVDSAVITAAEGEVSNFNALLTSFGVKTQ